MAHNPSYIPPTHNMLALLCVTSLALAAGHKLDGAKFGSKSSYFTVANQDTSSLEVISNKSHITLKLFSCARTMLGVSP